MQTIISTSLHSGVTLGVVYGSPLTVTDTGYISNNHTGSGIYSTYAAAVTNQGGIYVSAPDANARYYYGIGLKGGGSVFNSGSITGNNYTGIRLSFGGLVTNTGFIAAGRTGLADDGNVSLNNAGGITGGVAGVFIQNGNASITNSGSIYGNNGIWVVAGIGYVTNSGTVLGRATYGVSLESGGTITNQAGGLIQGTYYTEKGAIEIGGANYTATARGLVNNAGIIIDAIRFYAGDKLPQTVINSGTILGTLGTAVAFSSGNDVLEFDGTAPKVQGIVDGGGGTNTLEFNFLDTGGTLTGIGAYFINFSKGTVGVGVVATLAGSVTFGHSVTLANSGALIDTGTVTNAGWITHASGGTALTLASGGTLSNAGNITGGIAVDAPSGTGVIDNRGVLNGTATDGIVLSGGTIINGVSGVTTALIAGATYGILADGVATVTNYGAIEGPGNVANTGGVHLAAGGNVSNAGHLSGRYAVVITGGAGTVSNTGTISATTLKGVSLGSGGSVSNAGLITASEAIVIYGGAGTVSDTGTIDGSSFGVYEKAGGSVSVGASGIISAQITGIRIAGTGGSLGNTGTISAVSDGVVFTALGTVSNYGVIDGGIDGVVFLTAGGTVVDGGTIEGSARAIDLAGTSVSNLLVLTHGYALTGSVYGGVSATNTLELLGTAATASVTANYNGLALAHFSTIAFAAGNSNFADLKITNNATLPGTLVNFSGLHDTVDLTTLAYVSGSSSANFNTASDKLTVSNGTNAVTLQLGSGSYNGIAWSVHNDVTIGGTGGSEILVNSVQTGFTIHNESDLNSAFSAISVGGIDSQANTEFTLTFANSFPLTSAVSAPTLASGSSVTLAGGGFTLSGDGTAQNFLNSTAPITFSNLDIANVAATALSGAYWTFAGTDTLGVGTTLKNSGTVAVTGQLYDAGTFSNAGTLNGEIALTGNGGFTNAVGGYVANGYVSGVSGSNAGTVANLGTLSASSGYAIYLHGTGSVTNAAGALINGPTGIRLAGTNATVGNLGAINAHQNFPHSSAIYLRNGGLVTNGQSGNTTSGISGYYGVGISGAAGTVINDATIISTGDASISGSTAQIAGVVLNDGGNLTNGASGVSGAFISAVLNGVVIAGNGSVSNRGSIAGGGVGVWFYGTTSTGTLVNYGGITGGRGGILDPGTLALSNFGSITGGGVAVGANAGAITNAANAVMSAETLGVLLLGGGTITNAGTISATLSAGIGAYFGAGDSTLIDSGSISGATIAVAFAGVASNVLVLERGFAFSGAISAAPGASNSVELLGTSSANAVTATYNSLGLTNFSTVGFAPGNGNYADLKITNTAALPGTVTNFTGPHDTIDLTQLAFVLGSSSATFNTTTHKLIVSNGTGSVALQLGSGSYTGQQWSVTNDGSGGSEVLGLNNSFLIHNETELNSVFSAIGVGGSYSQPDIAFDLTFANSFALTSAVSSLTLASGSSVTFTGSGFTLSGNGTAQNFLNAAEPITITDLDIVDAVATVVSGAAWSLTGSDTFGAGTMLTNSGTVTDAGTLVDAGTILNGIILGGATALLSVASTGALLNGATASAAVVGYAGGSVTNSGTIRNTAGSAIRITGAAASVTNFGTIDGAGDAGISLGAGGSVNNDGMVTGTSGVLITGGTGTVNGDGTAIGTSGAAVSLAAGGYVTVGGTDTGTGGVVITGGAGTVDNGGSIIGASGAGVSLGAGGSFTNGGYVSGAFGVAITGGAGSISNGEKIIGTSGAGISLAAGGSISNGGSVTGTSGIVITGGAGTISNGNSIIGTAGVGVSFGAGGSLSNGGMITGTTGVTIAGGAGTVENGGTISGTLGIAFGGSYNDTVTDGGTIIGTGGTAVSFGGGNDLLRFQPGGGAWIQGTVNGGGGTNTLVFTSATTKGTLTGVGADFVNFATGSVNAGASWVLAGSNTFDSGLTLTNSGTLVDTGALTNAGTLNGALTVGSGGILTNALHGVITAGASAVIGAGGFATVVNGGSILANPGSLGGVGIYLNAGGLVSNQTGGVISGLFGIGGGTIADTVFNTGTILGNATASGTGIALGAGGTVSNQSGGLISAQYAVLAQLHAVTVVNTGSIAGNNSSGGGIELQAGGLVSNQSGGTITGSFGVIASAYPTTVVNAGHIVGYFQGVAGVGVYVGGGGLVTNQSTGTILGFIGISGHATALTVNNAGSVGGNATSGAGISLTAGGQVTNQSGGVITGKYGVRVSTNAATVVNTGSIGGNATSGQGVALAAGGTLTNLSGGVITGLQGVRGTSSSAVVVNAGDIAGNATAASGNGVALYKGGTITNEAGATISGFTGIVGSTAAVTAIDAGAIIGVHGTAISFGTANDLLQFQSGGAYIEGAVDGGGGTNSLQFVSSVAAGTLTGSNADFVDFQTASVAAGASWVFAGSNTLGANTTLVDAGTLTNTGSLVVDPPLIVTGTFVNSSIVSAPGTYNAIYIAPGGVVSNLSAGLIVAGRNGVYANSAVATINNLGTIESTATTQGFGVSLNAGGAVINGSSGDTSALLYGYGGVIAGAAAMTIENYGTIRANPAGDGFGIVLNASGSVINGASGATQALIEGGRFGISDNAGLLTVANYGTVSGTDIGIYLIGGGTVTDAGTIIGGGAAAVAFGVGSSGTNLLVLEGGYALSGTVIGPNSTAATNVVELQGSAAAPVTATYSSLHLTNFSTVAFAAGNSNYADLKLTSNATPPVTIAHFTGAHDAIDLTALTYVSASSRANFNSIAHQLTVTNGTSSVTLQLGSGNYTNVTWTVGNDGSGGSEVVPLAIQTGFTIHNENDLNSAFAAISTDGADATTNIPYTLIFANNVSLSSAVSTLALQSGSSVTLDGAGFTLSSGGGAYGFINGAGPIAVESLDIAGVVATVVSGGSWTFAGTDTLGAGTTLTNSGSVDDIGMLTDAGTIIGPIALGTSTALLSVTSSGAVTNTGTTALISGNAATVINDGTISGGSGAAISIANAGSVLNRGSISSNASFAVYAGTGTVTNLGTISDGTTVGFAVRSVSGVVINGSNGATSALITSAHTGLYDSGSGGSVVNYGTVSGSFFGVKVQTGSGTPAITNRGTILSARLALGVYGSGGSVNNSGVIEGTAASSYGVYFRVNGSLTNSGLIVGATDGFRVATRYTAVVDNTGTLGGGIGFVAVGTSTSSETLLDSGTLTGTSGLAAVFGPGNDLLRFVPSASAAVQGTVNGGGGTNTLEFASATTTGTLTGFGADFVNFQSMQIDSGAAWVLAGNNTFGNGANLIDNGSLTIAGTVIGNIYGNPGAAPLTIDASGYASNGGTLSAIYFNTGTVVNFGTIVASGGASTDDGVRIRGIGSVDNHGSIAGHYGVVAYGYLTVSNSGTLGSSGSKDGVFLRGGGSVGNTGVILGDTGVQGPILSLAATINNTGTINGLNGVHFAATDTAAATVIDSGTIIGLSGPAVQFGYGTNVMQFAPGNVFVQGGVVGGVSAVSNTLEFASGASNGTLTGAGAYFVNFGTGTVDAGAVWTLAGNVTFGSNVTLHANGTLIDDGSLINDGQLQATNYGALQIGAGGYLRNDASGVITRGTIGGATFNAAILGVGSAAVIVNDGTIRNSQADVGIYLKAGGTIINGAPSAPSALISANLAAYVRGIATVGNYATIAGYEGVELYNGGVIRNGASGSTAALISGGQYGAALDHRGTLSNYGTITAASAFGVRMRYGGSLTNVGHITGASGIVVQIGRVSITNSGTVVGTGGDGISLTGGGTVTDSGRIAGNSIAVAFGGTSSNLLILENGYSLSGQVFGSASASNTLELLGTSAANAVTATYNSLGLTNFGTVAFATGVTNYATLDITNNSTLPGTITGFVQHGDIVDLTALNDSGNNASTQFNTVTNELTVAAGTQSVTLQLGAGNYSNVTFVAENDGTNGTEVLVRGPIQTTFTIHNETELNSAIQLISLGGYDAESNTNYTLIFANGFGLNSAVSTVSLASGSSLTINGGGFTLDGGSANNNFLNDAGPVTLQNLAIVNAIATAVSGATWTFAGSDTLGSNATLNSSATLLDVGTLTVSGTLNGALDLQAAQLTNLATGVIENTYIDALSANSASTVANYGAISSTNTGHFVMYLAGTGNVLNGEGGLIQGPMGIRLNGPDATVTNLGSINAYAGGASNDSILMNNGGVVINGASNDTTAVISGYYQVAIFSIINSSYTGTVFNDGSIISTSSLAAAVRLANGGSVTNGASGIATALMQGGRYGVAVNANGDVANYGTIRATQSSSPGYGVFVSGAGTVSNLGASALIEGPTGVELFGAGTVINAGTIASSEGTVGTAILFGSGYSWLVDVPGAVFVGTVQGLGGTAAPTVLELAGGANQGTLSGLGSQFVGFNVIGVDTNASWDLAGTNSIASRSALYVYGTLDNTGTLTNRGVAFVAGTLINSGTMRGGAPIYMGRASLTNQAGGYIYSYGIYGVRTGGADTIVNQGSIASQSRRAIYLNAAGTITNAAGGQIYDLHNGVILTGTGAVLANQGGITAARNYAVYAANNGQVTNGQSGSIDGYAGVAFRARGTGTIDGTLSNDGTIDGIGGASAAGVVVLSGSADIDNAGLIQGTGFGVASNAGGALVNYGTIAATNTGSPSYGISFAGTGTISNLGPAAVVEGNVGIAFGGTIIDSGAIVGTGGTAVTFASGTNLLRFVPGAASITGAVNGGSGSSTLEFASGTGTGTLTGAGASFTNFSNATVDAGASWVLSGSDTLSPGLTLTDSGTLTVGGTLSNAGTIVVDPPLIVANLLINSDTIAASGTYTAVSVVAGGTVSNTASGVISGGNYAVAGAVALSNYGTISASLAGVLGQASGHVLNGGLIAGTGTAGEGIRFLATGTISNQSAGTISGVYGGVDFSTAAGTVINTGLIQGNSTDSVSFGVYLGAGGLVSNQSGGVISGGQAGVWSGIGGGTISLVNAGVIAGNATALSSGGLFAGNGSISNQSGGTISGGLSGLSFIGGAASVTNAGLIAGGAVLSASSGILVDAGGLVSNQASGTIGGQAAGINAINAAATVVNAGNVYASQTYTGAVGIGFAAGGLVSNQSGGVISAYDGVRGRGQPMTLLNAGSISGTNDGVLLSAGGSVSNQAGGTIAGQAAGISADNAAATVVNAGNVYAAQTNASAVGIVFAAGGLVSNQTGGVISAYDGVEGLGQPMTLVNAGNVSGAHGGVLLDAGGLVSNQAGGTISGEATGISAINTAATVVNGGNVSGAHDGVLLNAGGTIVDSGTISGGGAAVATTGTNSSVLVLEEGYALQGAVIGSNNASNTLELLGSSAADAVIANYNNLGLSNFGTLAFATGAANYATLNVTNNAALPDTITGFIDSGDTIDLTTLADPGNDAFTSFDTLTNRLTVSTGDGSVVLQLGPASYNGLSFVADSDGKGDTEVHPEGATLPVVTGAVANQAVPNQTPSTPFAAVSIIDSNVGATDTVTISFYPTGGTLSNLGGGSFNNGTYTIAGTPQVVTATVDALVFTPNPPAAGFIASSFFQIHVAGPGGTVLDQTADLTSVQQVLGLANLAANQIAFSVSPGGTGFASPVAGKTNEAVIPGVAEGGSYQLPSGYQAIFIGGTGIPGRDDAALSDNSVGNAILVGNDGNDTITASAGNDSIIAGNGNNVLTGGGGNVAIIAANGNNVISAMNASTFSIRAGNGNDTISASGTGTIFGGTGSNQISTGGNATILSMGANDTVSALAGAASVSASGFGALVFGTFSNPSGTLNVAATGGRATVSAGNSTASVTTSGGNALVYGGFGSAAGGFTWVDNSGNDTLAAGNSNVSATMNGSNALLFGNFDGGTSNLNLLVKGTADTLSAGNSTVSATLNGANTLLFGSFASNPGRLTLIDAGNGDTISGANSATNITAQGNGLLVFGGAGTLNFVGDGGTATVVGGAGATSVTGGSGGMTLYGSAGNVMTFSGSGPVVYVAAAGNETLNASSASGNATLVGGNDANGATSIVGGSGNDILYAGAGADTLAGGSGANSFQFFSSLTRGNADVILDFTQNDTVLLSGYGAGPAISSSGGNTTLTLTDNTRVTFVGVSASALQGHIVST